MRPRLVAWALGAYGLLLVAGTGWLTADRWYPSAPGATDGPPWVLRSLAAHDAHVAAAWAVSIALAVGVVALVAVGRQRDALLAGSVLAAAAFAHASGPALAWQQVALRSITTGTEIGGVWMVLDDDVLFAIVGDAEVTPGEYRNAVVLHTAPLLVPLVVAGISLRRRRS